jgi:hypothetical protein
MEYRKINTLNLQEVETEIEFLLSISNDPNDKLIKEINSLMIIAKALGTDRKW